LRLNALMLSHLDCPTSEVSLRTTSRLGGKKNDYNSVQKKVQKKCKRMEWDAQQRYRIMLEQDQ